MNTAHKRGCDVLQPQRCCRICLCSKATKDITLLNSIENGVKPSEIVLFCLDIQIEDGSKYTVLCLKCFKKINEFHQFKTLAHKSDAYLRSLDLPIKEEGLVTCNEHEIESLCDDETYIEVPVLKECKQENELTIEPNQNITYEYVIHINHNDFKKARSVNLEKNKQLSVTKGSKQRERKINTKRKKEKSPKTKQRKQIMSEDKFEICPECGKQVRSVKEHSVIHLPKDQRKKYKCSLCEKVYKNRVSRYTHFKTNHTENGKKKCNLCGVTVGVPTFKQHMKRVHGNHPFHCQICHKKFLTQKTLQIHLNQHAGDKTCQCDVCGEKYTTMRLLSFHKRRVHQQERNFTCDYCSKSFFRKERLMEHIRIHTGERPYKCPDCNKAFMSSHSLRVHLLTHGEKKYHCTLCSKSFINSTRLKTHTLTHTKEKKYPCQHCGVGFLRSDHRNRHERTAHKKLTLSDLTVDSCRTNQLKKNVKV